MKRKLIAEFGMTIYEKICIQSKAHGYGIVLPAEQIIIHE